MGRAAGAAPRKRSVCIDCAYAGVEQTVLHHIARRGAVGLAVIGLSVGINAHSALLSQADSQPLFLQLLAPAAVESVAAVVTGAAVTNG